MTIYSFAQEQRLPISREEAWDFFSTPHNLDGITPPDLGFKITSLPGDRMYEGQIICYRIRVLPLVTVTWVTEIKSVEQGVSFIDEQRFGPYRFWHHRHTFEEIPGGVVMRDLVHYGLGFGPFGALANALIVRKKLDHIFGFRKIILAERLGTL